jgi:peroxisomal membrane protein 4
MLLPALRAMRNGVEVGVKMRAAHCLVIILLYRRNVPILKNLKFLIDSVREHAGNLGTFAFFYKLLKALIEEHLHIPRSLSAFASGSIVGHYVWGREKTALKYQIVLYLLSRNIAAISTKLSEKGYLPSGKYSQIAALTWGVVMALHSEIPESMQEGLRSSMDFLYNDDNHWVAKGKKSVSDFIPFC